MAGGAISGALLYGALGLVANIPYVRTVVAVIAATWLVVCLGWHALGRTSVPFGRQGIQANRSLARRGPLGLAYFGALLGMGVFTEMASPLVIGGALLSITWGAHWGLSYGLSFGVARSMPAFRGAIAGSEGLSIHLPEKAVRRRNQFSTRVVGVSVSAVLLGLLLLV
jgi:hypothetical protein